VGETLLTDPHLCVVVASHCVCVVCHCVFGRVCCLFFVCRFCVFACALVQVQKELEEHETQSQEQIRKLEEDAVYLTGELNKAKEASAGVKQLEAKLAEAKKRADSLEATNSMLEASNRGFATESGSMSVIERGPSAKSARTPPTGRGGHGSSQSVIEGSSASSKKESASVAPVSPRQARGPTTGEGPSLQVKLTNILDGKIGTISGAEEVFKKPENRQTVATCLKQALRNSSAEKLALKSESTLVSALKACVGQCDMADEADQKVGRAVLKAAPRITGVRPSLKVLPQLASVALWASVVDRRVRKGGEDANARDTLLAVLSEMIDWGLEEPLLVEVVAAVSPSLDLTDDESVAVLDDAYGGQSRRPSFMAAPPPISPKGARPGAPPMKKAPVKMPRLSPRPVVEVSPEVSPRSDTSPRPDAGDDEDGTAAGGGAVHREGPLKYKKGTRWLKASVALKCVASVSVAVLY
jgi:hypothetical protein